MGKEKSKIVILDILNQNACWTSCTVVNEATEYTSLKAQ